MDWVYWVLQCWIVFCTASALTVTLSTKEGKERDSVTAAIVLAIGALMVWAVYYIAH